MRVSKASVIAGLALLAVAPLPVATAISAAATPTPSSFGLGDLDDTVGDVVEEGTGTVKDVVKTALPSDPDDDEPETVPTVPTVPSVPTLPEKEPEPAPAPVVKTPQLPRPPATTTDPRPAPAPAPRPTQDKPAASDSNPGSSTGGGTSAGSGAGGAGTPDSTRPGPTLLGDPRGAEFASSGSNSSIPYSGMSPLLPEANSGDPNIRSLLIAGGQQNQAISPVADDSAGSVAGLLALGTLASLMLFGSAAYLKYGKRRPAVGKHKA
jgi:outer membrane biosynthesis protein TonB